MHHKDLHLVFIDMEKVSA